MIGGILEIAQDGRHLSVQRGFALIRDPQGQQLGQVVLDQLTAVLLTSPQVTVSKPLLTALMERGIPLVSCGPNYHPDGIMLPYGGHWQQAGVLAEQIAVSPARKKRLWQQVVKTKLTQQRLTLEHCGGATATDTAKAIGFLADHVTSGDPDNKEAQAARIYWPALFGVDFRRDQTAGGQNAFLNYGYAVLRAAMARALVAAGLTPSLGLHHHQSGNAFALADDLMEPFRPLVDALVKRCDTPSPTEGAEGLSPSHKRQLVAVLLWDCDTAHGRSPVVNVMQALAHSLVRCLKDPKARLALPLASPLDPLEASSALAEEA